MNELIPISEIRQMAESVTGSGLFGIKTKDQATALMLIAQAENRHPASAAMDYHIIQGRPALKAETMLARFQAAGGKVAWNELSNAKVSATFSHPSGGSVQITWTLDDAKRAGLLGRDCWKQYPRAMLRSRTISEGIRTCLPAVLGGMYTVEEIENIPFEHEIEVEPNYYPEEKFEENIHKWKEVISAGQITPEEIVSRIESIGELTEEQKARIFEK